MKQKQRQVHITHNKAAYIITPLQSGWLKVTGSDHFEFKEDKKKGWIYSKDVDVDLQVRLQNEAIKEQLI